MNVLSEDKQSELLRLFEEGKGNRDIARLTGVQKSTVANYRKKLEAELGKIFLCPCGEPATHIGWCKFRYENSPERQETMKQLHQQDKHTEILKLRVQQGEKKTPTEKTEEVYSNDDFLECLMDFLRELPAFDPEWDSLKSDRWFHAFNLFVSEIKSIRNKDIKTFTGVGHIEIVDKCNKPPYCQACVVFDDMTASFYPVEGKTEEEAVKNAKDLAHRLNIQIYEKKETTEVI